MIREDSVTDCLRNQATNSLYSLQSRLLEAWTALKVEDYYQNIVLHHLDEMSLPQAEEAIAKEIRDTT
jgi:hypothetical protein